MAIQPFTIGATVTCTSTGTSAAVSISGSGSALELQNMSSVTLYVALATTSPATAGLTSYPVLAGQSKLITRSSDQTSIACVVASGTGTLSVTAGEGI